MLKISLLFNKFTNFQRIFQDIDFISTQTDREIFKSALSEPLSCWN